MVIEPRSARNVDAEAAAWLARLQGPARNADVEAAWKAWLRADAMHRQAFERATEIWEVVPGAISARTPITAAQPPRFRFPALATALAAMLLVVGAGIFTLMFQAPVHQTGIGGQQIVMLEDGSRISLNTDSRVTVLYSDGERRIRLDRGEALFEVARNPLRPFIVDAGNDHVRAIGTAFVVRRHIGRTIEVTLLEGKVDVFDKKRVALLSPGERVTIGGTPKPVIDRPPQETVAAWRRGEVVFEDVALAQALAELSRYSKSPIALSDPALGRLRISGAFSTGNIDEAVTAVALLHRLKIHRTDGKLLLARE